MRERKRILVQAQIAKNCLKLNKIVLFFVFSVIKTLGKLKLLRMYDHNLRTYSHINYVICNNVFGWDNLKNNLGNRSSLINFNFKHIHKNVYWFFRYQSVQIYPTCSCYLQGPHSIQCYSVFFYSHRFQHTILINIYPYTNDNSVHLLRVNRTTLPNGRVSHQWEKDNVRTIRNHISIIYPVPRTLQYDHEIFFNDSHVNLCNIFPAFVSPFERSTNCRDHRRNNSMLSIPRCFSVFPSQLPFRPMPSCSSDQTLLTDTVIAAGSLRSWTAVRLRLASAGNYGRPPKRYTRDTGIISWIWKRPGGRTRAANENPVHWVHSAPTAVIRTYQGWPFVDFMSNNRAEGTEDGEHNGGRSF